MHEVALVHEIPPSELTLVVEPFALGTTDQAEPFHISVSVSWVVAPSYVPTAIQNVGPLHDTAERELSVEDDVFGLGTIDQEETVAAVEADAVSASTLPARHASPIALRKSDP